VVGGFGTVLSEQDLSANRESNGESGGALEGAVEDIEALIHDIETLVATENPERDEIASELPNRVMIPLHAGDG
jgi:hypothetical protein